MKKPGREDDTLSFRERVITPALFQPRCSEHSSENWWLRENDSLRAQFPLTQRINIQGELRSRLLANSRASAVCPLAVISSQYRSSRHFGLVCDILFCYSVLSCFDCSIKKKIAVCRMFALDLCGVILLNVWMNKTAFDHWKIKVKPEFSFLPHSSFRASVSRGF